MLTIQDNRSRVLQRDESGFDDMNALWIGTEAILISGQAEIRRDCGQHKVEKKPSPRSRVYD